MRVRVRVRVRVVVVVRVSVSVSVRVRGRGRGRDRGRVRVRVTDEGHHVEQRVVEEVLVVGLVLHVAQRGLRSEDRVGVVPG